MNIVIVGGSVFAFAFGSLLLFCTLYILNDWKAKRLGKKGRLRFTLFGTIVGVLLTFILAVVSWLFGVGLMTGFVVS